MAFYVYILASRQRGRLYTDVTNDLAGGFSSIGKNAPRALHDITMWHGWFGTRPLTCLTPRLPDKSA